MYIEIDFQSDEAIYQQLCRQIVIGIATNALKEGESLPSVRDMAEKIGINMHTVNKSYSILKDEGFLTVDRRRGAVVYVNPEKVDGEAELKESLRVALAKASVRKVPVERIHELIDEVCREYETGEAEG